jgi:hypothetical protein
MKNLLFLAIAPFVLLTSNLISEHKAKQEFKKTNFTPYHTEVTVSKVTTSPLKVSASEIMEMNAIKDGTHSTTFGYVLVADYNARQQNSGIFHGYFFYGECLVYGTLIMGDNGVNLFVPCGIHCIGFPDICPSDFGADGLCKMTFN